MPTEQSGISIDASELGKVLKQLEQTALGSTQAALEQIAVIMTGLVEDEFQTEGRGAWPTFAESTLEERMRKGGSPKLLQDTGVAAGSVAGVVEDNAAVAFTNVPYMIYHTSSAPRHVIPYRNPFDIPQDQLLEQAAEIVLAAITAHL
jgi:phage gpG-like protein